MHARWLIDSAALLAYHTPQFVQARQPLPSAAFYDYWGASRQRVDDWHRSIREHREAIEGTDGAYHQWIWLQLQPTVEEVLLSDCLVRVMCGLTAKLEHLQIDLDAAPIAASVLASQDECRNRCVQVLKEVHRTAATWAARMHHVRRSLECWTDTLLGTISDCPQVSKFRFQTDVSAATVPPRDAAQRRLRWQFMLAGCQQWVASNCVSTSASPLHNAQIHHAAFRLLQPQWCEAIQYDPSRQQHTCEQLVEGLCSLVAGEKG